MAKGALAQKLLALVDIVTTAANVIVEEYEKEDAEPQRDSEEQSLPSAALYDAGRAIISACGSFVELLQAPDEHVISLGFAYFQSRALHVAAEHSIADHLANADQSTGMHSSDLSQAVGIRPQNLSRIMRTLCSAHVFAEVQEDRFTNNRVSSAMVETIPLNAWLAVAGEYGYASAAKLPEYLVDPANDESVLSGFQRAFDTQLSCYEWFQEHDGPCNPREPRPGKALLGLGMMAAGRFGRALYYDFPWASLGSGTIVDVGGGFGGMSLDLSKSYPQLNFVVQDLPGIIEQAPAVWQRELPSVLDAGRVTFMPHDFFLDNPVKDADVYLLRHILHNWQDEQCIAILSAVRAALAPHSRVLIAEVVVNTTFGCPEMKSAPPPLLANYSIASTYAHVMDLTMMTYFKGMERTPAQFRVLAERAGLTVVGIWDCRCAQSIVELRLS